MEIQVQENDTVRSAYSFAGPFRYTYIMAIVLFIASLTTYDIFWIIPFTVPLYVFGFICLRPMRIASFSDESLKATWPRKEVRRYEEIRRIINISPYDYCVHFIIIVYKKGILFEKVNMAWIPVDQGIIEHLKAHGVKIWNLWFWQE